jgi:hypothetical protein
MHTTNAERPPPVVDDPELSPWERDVLVPVLVSAIVKKLRAEQSPLRRPAA